MVKNIKQSLLIALGLCQSHYVSNLVNNLSEGLHKDKCIAFKS